MTRMAASRLDGQPPCPRFPPQHRTRQRIDMTADVVINIDERHDVLCLPLTAIRTLEDQDATVYVLDDDSKVVTRHIKVGLSDEKNAEVISGLTLDDRVVIGDDVQTAESDAMNNDGFGKHRRGPF